MFILGRAVSGAGAAGIFSGGLSILAVVAPLSKRPLYTSALGSLFGVATITGPIIGGALTTSVSWRWCFYINLPVGAVTLVALALLFRPPERDSDKKPLMQKVRQIDTIGCLIFIPTIVMTLLALQWGGQKYPWKSATVIGLFCGSAVLATIFLVWEYRQGDKAMIPFSILFQRSILLSCLFSTLMFGGYLLNNYYIPEWFQIIKGASPLHSGVMTLPMVCTQIVASISAGLISKYNRKVTGGLTKRRNTLTSVAQSIARATTTPGFSSALDSWPSPQGSTLPSPRQLHMQSGSRT